MSIISLQLFPALSSDWSMEHELEELHFSEYQMIFHILEHPVSLCVNIMAERQGKEMEKGMRKEGKNGKSRRKEQEGERWKEEGKWKEKTIHVRFLS